MLLSAAAFYVCIVAFQLDCIFVIMRGSSQLSSGSSQLSSGSSQSVPCIAMCVHP